MNENALSRENIFKEEITFACSYKAQTVVVEPQQSGTQVT
jgi:hypothetical protein